ncbi:MULTISPECIES: fimbrial protein [unclassified Providencia]|uniref:Type 1 fimbrial protein n=1 Tax=Providencia stuartii TaxID=588 RepID=A0AAI9HY28_PROST|nr:MULTISPECIES: fimbrial protein [unclassified Providencia]ELR5034177.1 type 1 fimbrial protein [Providencia stuartii]
MTVAHRTLQGMPLSCLGWILLTSSALGSTLDKVDNWDVDGAHGALYVQGALTESACRLAMPSTYQTVDLGTIGTGQVEKVGQMGTPIAIQLRLEDCLRGESRSRNKAGNVLWSPDMPAMKIRFLAPTDAQDEQLVSVLGAKGMGLRLSDAERNPITLGQYSHPQLISSGHNQLTYYITPVRTTAELRSGAYRALIRFQVSYE